jgi:hypothetical protein
MSIGREDHAGQVVRSSCRSLGGSTCLQSARETALASLAAWSQARSRAAGDIFASAGHSLPGPPGENLRLVMKGTTP